MRTIICGCDPWWGRGDACSERQATLDLLNSHWMKVPTEMREVPNALCRYVVAYHARLHGAVGASSKNHKQTSQNGRILKPKIEPRVPARWLHSPRSNTHSEQASPLPHHGSQPQIIVLITLPILLIKWIFFFGCSND